MYNLNMKTISTTEARKNIKTVMDLVTEEDEVFVIKNHNTPEVIMIKYPKYYNPELSDITNFSANYGAFDFLHEEPDIYSIDDVKEKYDW
jgi:hypothetical protein